MIKGIDVSEYQGYIDFKEVKKSGVGVVICRYADGNYIDEYFDRNMQECEKVGLHFGAYILTRAKDAACAQKEANRIIAAAKKYSYDMPLYIDVEADEAKKNANEIIDAFLDVCDKKKVKGGIYANLTWFVNYIDVYKYKDRPLWLAQYNNKITNLDPSLFGMWQYTSSGRVPGIVGPVDLDEVYVKYWENLPAIPDNIKAMAVDCILGEYGNGEERKERLGEYYEAVQNVVNLIYKNMEV